MNEYPINKLCKGEHFFFAGMEWIVLDPNYSENSEEGVFAILASTWNSKKYPFDEDNSNNYASSTLREKLKNELLPILGEENLIAHKVDLIADNGDPAYGTVTDYVFILSCDEYRKYHDHVPLIEEFMWTCTPWYINHDSDTAYGDYPCTVYTTGGVGSCYYAGNALGVLPACILKSSNLKLRRQAQIVVK